MELGSARELKALLLGGLRRCEVLGLTDPGATRDLGMVWSGQRRMLPSAALFRDHVLTTARRGHLAVPFG